ncbi:MAG TPA: hypothetical protein VIH28_07135 [Ignavibacteriaceae bacterium]
MKNKATALKAKVQNIIDNSEYRGVKVLGITCSRADLEMIVHYLDRFLRNGNINGLMFPCGNVKEVIEKSGIKLN